jgi:hypothetical protein
LAPLTSHNDSEAQNSDAVWFLRSPCITTRL